MTSSPDRASAATSPATRRHVFVDGAVLTTVEPSADRRHDGRRIVVPGAAEAVQLLLDGHDVVVITDDSLADVTELGEVPTAPAVPATFPHGSWYVTADGSWCEGDRPTGLRTILVGPKRPPARRPTLRCDIEARDVTAAVMEILVRETMAS